MRLVVDDKKQGVFFTIHPFSKGLHLLCFTPQLDFFSLGSVPDHMLFHSTCAQVFGSDVVEKSRFALDERLQTINSLATWKFVDSIKQLNMLKVPRLLK